ncbi:dihydroorotate dehydrogenase family protein [Candidatus Vecturithrix granuli]|uniref:Dihydroorotate dehydrogenase family protein n=1 Tax=Vecturithrix granuli TaxID=1499967 RepID=A0A081C133_VECG1|nr:dihydroorotate dehydrogenase family protein [Candidatus Vecturithrix granuli]
MTSTFLGKQISGCFTIPSGVMTTQISVIERIARDIPEIGIITTKSVGLYARNGYREPVLTQYAPGSFMNAVGLTNPGVEAFAAQLQTLRLPPDRFLLTSIFGGTIDEFVEVAKRLAPYSDGLELNLSCPHASGYGMTLGQNAQLVHDVTHAVKQAVSIPVIPKLTPNVNNIADIAKAAVQAGADALCAINTVGPGYYTYDGSPVLTNAYGGMSGNGIFPIGLKCVRDIAQAVDVPLIGCGGVSTAEDVRAYQQAGASIIGIGSALAGLPSEKLPTYFHALTTDLRYQTNTASMLLQNVDMTFTPYCLSENRRLAEDLSLLTFDGNLAIQPGQFIFLWLPEVGEKPFSVLDEQPLTLAIQQRGCFTKKLCQLQPGDLVYVRGPYGMSVNIPQNSSPIFVCGGCGLAAIYPLAKSIQHSTLFVGARDARHLFYLDHAGKIAELHIATEDGSLGFQGVITELLDRYLQQRAAGISPIFFNCGPQAMIATAVELEQCYTSTENIYSAIDYVAKCGVGLCGSCSAPDGRRLCVDGPFLKESYM